MIAVDEDELYRILGENLKRVREDAEIKQHFVAEQVQLLRTSISNIESGRQRPPLGLIFRICLVLGVEVAEVLPKLQNVLKEIAVDVETEQGIKKMPPKAAELFKKILND